MERKEIVERASNWYDWSRCFVPSLGTREFSEFAGQSNVFTYSLNPRLNRVAIKVDPESETAYVNLEKQDIYLSARFFVPEMYLARFGEDLTDDEAARVAISVINGCVIHEANHLRLTPKYSINTMEISPITYSLIERYGKKLVFNVFNIIEDLYIDSHTPEKLVNWLQAALSTLIPTSFLDEIRDKPMDLKKALNLAISFKNPESRGDDLFQSLPGEALQVLKEATQLDKDKIELRLQLTARFLVAIEDLIEGGENGNDDGSDPENDNDDDSGPEMDLPTEQAVGEGARALEAATDAAKKMKKADMEAVAKESKRVDSETSHTPGRGVGRVFWNEMIEVDIKNLDLFRSYKTIHPDNEVDFRFLRDLVASRTKNRSPGRATNRGPVMVKQRLTRIATDGKIFAKNDSTKRTGRRIEIIILVDLSGSTHGQTVNREVGAAREISRALTESNIANAVYGHTSIGPYRNNNPLLIHVTSHDMQITTPDHGKRFERLTHFKDLSENYDGVALQEINKKFTNREATRYIIVLSDGKPTNGTTYDGLGAIDHTMTVVESIRRKGTTIFSMSVVESVVHDNNQIYGREFNIDTSHNLRGQFKKLIQKIVM